MFHLWSHSLFMLSEFLSTQTIWTRMDSTADWVQMDSIHSTADFLTLFILSIYSLIGLHLLFFREIITFWETWLQKGIMHCLPINLVQFESCPANIYAIIYLFNVGCNNYIQIQNNNSLIISFIFVETVLIGNFFFRRYVSVSC